MHEGSIAQSLLDAALRQLPPRAARITRLVATIGVLSGVERQSLLAFFEILAAGTKAQGAVLEIRPQSAKLVCGDCGAVEEFDNTRALEPVCRVCGGPNRLEGGADMILQSLDVEMET